VAKFDQGECHFDVLDLDASDPQVVLKDTRGICYRGRDYLSTMSHIRLARSRDGVHFEVDPAPFLSPANQSEEFGVEDARVTRLGDTYWINYTAVSRDGWYTCLASTRDFKNIQRHGIIFAPQNKDVCIFGEKINGQYAALHRPNNEGFGKPSIWYAQSPDLLHWGGHRCVMRPRPIPAESFKIGGGAPCLKTDRGWLQIYHGKGEDGYSLFSALLDLSKPYRVLARGSKPLLHPEASYETEGFFANVVFTNGMVERGDGKLLIYYGACDGTVCLAESSVTEIFDNLKQC